MENADDLYEKHAGELLSPPSKEGMEDFPPLVPHTFTIDQPKWTLSFQD